MFPEPSLDDAVSVYLYPIVMACIQDSDGSKTKCPDIRISHHCIQLCMQNLPWVPQFSNTLGELKEENSNVSSLLLKFDGTVSLQ